MCGWPLQSAAAMLEEAGSAGSHLARPAVGQRTFAVTTFVNHIIYWHESNTYSVPGVVLDPVMGVKVEIRSLASKTMLRGSNTNTHMN